MEITLIKKKDGLIDRKNGELISRLKVVAYARVSTDSEEQLNSYESQKKYYKEKIVSNPEWAFIDIYADEAISGTQDFKRTNFMRMIDDGLKGKYISPINSINSAPNPFLNLYNPYWGWFSSTTPETPLKSYTSCPAAIASWIPVHCNK